MTAIAHVPGRAWAGAHHVLTLVAVLAVLALAAAVTVTVVLLSGDETAGTSIAPLPGTTDTCVAGPVRTPC